MKLKFTWIPFILALIVTIPIKLFITTNLNQVLGNYFNEEICSYLLFWIAIIFTLIIISMSFLSKDVPLNVKIKKNIFLGITITLLGISMLYNGLIGILYINKTGNQSFLDILLVITAILSGVVFFIVAACFYSEKNIFDKMAPLSLVPVVWAGTYLISVFVVHHKSTATVGIEMFDVLAAVFLLLFLFTLTKMFVPIDKCNVVKRLYAFGMPAALFFILESPTTLYNSMEFSLTEMFSTQLIFKALLIINIVFILIYVLSLLWYVNTNRKV